MDIIQQYPLVVLTTGAVLIALALITTILSKRKGKGEKAKKDVPSTNNPKEEVIQLEKPKEKEVKTAEVKSTSSGGKKKRKKVEKSEEESKIKTPQQLGEAYPTLYYGALSLRSQNAMYSVLAVGVRHGHVLFSTTKNELVMYDLRKWKKDTACGERYFTSLDNNAASAVCIGHKYFYAALSFDKTIAYFEFMGGQDGVYFREVNRFKRYLYKTDASTIWVPQNESYIVTSGSGADTVINVWSMSGQKLAYLNTYQIEHYSIDYGKEMVLVRGWTSEVKMFKIATNKDHGFSSIEKSYHLTHSEHIRCSAIDNFGYYALTVCKGNIVKLWHTSSGDVNHPTQSTIDSYQLGIDEPTLCAVHTLQGANERLRTFVMIANQNSIVICDREWKVLQRLEGLSVESFFVTGAMKSAGLAVNGRDKMMIWNLTPLVENVAEYTL